MKHSTGWALLIAVVIVSACDEDDNGLSQKDRNFVINASEANRAEIELGQLAAERGSSEEVKAFGSHMVTEHTTAMNELQTLAVQKQASIGTTLSERHQNLKETLSNLTGYSFDTAYVNSQVVDHQMATSLFQSYRSNGDDAELKEYANKYLPHIQEHQTQADQLKATLDQAAPPVAAAGRQN